MKKTLLILSVILLLIVPMRVLAQELPDLGGGLPQLLGPIPDPGETLGSGGKVYAEHYNYHGSFYDTYLYARPASPADLTREYGSVKAGDGFIYYNDFVTVEKYDRDVEAFGEMIFDQVHYFFTVPLP